MANTAKTRTRKTAQIEQPAPDLSALVASGAVTIEVIDVATAQLDPNVRSEPVVSPEFVDSIRQDGVREPVYARRGDNGTVYVWDGSRRLTAAKEAGTTTMLGIFGLTPSTVADSARILDQLRTFNRADLNQADRITAYGQLALDGISEAQIARVAGEDRETVKKSVAVAKSTTAKETAATHGQLSLDRLILIAEFEDDAEAVEAITYAADDADLPYLAQEFRDTRATHEARTRLTAQYAEQGYIVFTDWSASEFRLLSGLTDAADAADERPALTDDDHTACAGRAVLIEVWGAEEKDADITFVCTTPDNHQPRHRAAAAAPAAPSPDETDEERAERVARAEAEAAAAAEAQTAARRRVRENNKAWRTATTVRREWVTALLGRKATPKDAAALVARTVAERPHLLTAGHASAQTGPFLGLGESYANRSKITGLVDTAPAKATRVSLAVILSAYEARAEEVDAWRYATGELREWSGLGVGDAVKVYFLALEAWGYKLSPVERIAAGYPDTTGTEPDPAPDVAEDAAAERGDYTIAAETDGGVVVIAEVTHSDITAADADAA